MASKKAIKKEVTIDFTNSVEKIKGAAKTVNNEVLTTATEVIEDLRNNGQRVTTIAKEKVNQAIEAATIENGVKFVKDTANDLNEFGLETADTVIETAKKEGKKWQGVASKAVKAGLEIQEKNQEIAFDALEAVKGQVTIGVKRFKSLFN